MSQIQQAQKLLDELEPHLAKVKQEIANAESRKALAKSQADNMEARAKSLLISIEAEAAQRRVELAKEHDEIKTKLDADISKLTSVKHDLEDDIVRLNESQVEIDLSTTQLVQSHSELSVEVAKKTQELDDVNKQLEAKAGSLRDLTVAEENLRASISELENAKVHSTADLEVLSSELEITENRIIEADAEYKARKEYINRQTTEVQRKLVGVLDRLTEAETKDKAIREAWADEYLKLEKRTQAIRKQEARLSDSEARIQELNNYMKT